MSPCRRSLLQVLGALLSFATPVIGHAEVVESLQYRWYDASPAPGESLSQALNRASPIRQGAQVFHGYTAWQVHWRFWWDESPSGQCRLTRVQTRLEGTISLPSLARASDTQRARFDRYQRALRNHEMGHFRFGQEAARAIDQRLTSLPAMTGCRELERQANILGQQRLQQAVEEEKDFDRRTGHGREEGAWLGD